MGYATLAGTPNFNLGVSVATDGGRTWTVAYAAQHSLLEGCSVTHGRHDPNVYFARRWQPSGYRTRTVMGTVTPLSGGRIRSLSLLAGPATGQRSGG
jgi:hypothetical protein